MNNSKEQQLNKLIKNRKQSITPKHDLWQEIESRIEKPSPSYKALVNSSYYRSAAVACLLMLSVLVGWQVKQTLYEQTTVSPAMLALIDQVAEQHQQQVGDLEKRVKLVDFQSIDSKPFSAGVSELRQAAKLVVEQLKKQPQDKQLWDLWLWLQRREIELLTQENRANQDQLSYL